MIQKRYTLDDCKRALAYKPRAYVGEPRPEPTTREKKLCRLLAWAVRRIETLQDPIDPPEPTQGEE